MECLVYMNEIAFGNLQPGEGFIMSDTGHSPFIKTKEVAVVLPDYPHNTQTMNAVCIETGNVFHIDENTVVIKISKLEVYV